MTDFYLGSLDGFKFLPLPTAVFDDQQFAYARAFVFNTLECEVDLTAEKPLWLPASVSTAWAIYTESLLEATDDPEVLSVPWEVFCHKQNPVALAAKQDGIKPLKVAALGSFYPYEWLKSQCQQNEASMKQIEKFSQAYDTQAPAWWFSRRKFGHPDPAQLYE